METSPAAHSHRPQALVGGALCGLAAAALFGMSAPLGKLLLPQSSPLLLAGQLYLGAGLALSLFRLLRWGWGRWRGTTTAEAPLRRSDALPLGLVLLLGGILGPLLMLSGLARSDGVPAALLLNLEAPLTMAVAVGLFGEHLGRRVLWSALLICGGAALLSVAGSGVAGRPGLDGVGGLLIGAACLCWAFDNNLTQRLSLRDPVALVQVKTLGAGLCNLAAGLLLGQRLPSPQLLCAALLLGALSYGLSVLLDAYALRLLGAAREAALFATAPFVGALLAVPLLGERLSATVGIAALLMGLGVGLLLRARHGHRHAHEPLYHEHLHSHDDHHQHEHAAGELPAMGGSHSHRHHHAPLVHDHSHLPDLHHRHRHDD